MPRLRRSAFALLLVGYLLSGLAGTVAAHVDVDVADGRYVMEVGFRDEPALQGQPNAVFVAVEEYGTGGTTPVDGLAGSLQAEVSRDGVTKTIALVPTGDGTYEAPFVPTATGDYTFRIFGEIAGNPVDESLTSGPQTFNSVDPLTSFEFPPASATASNLEADLAAARDSATQARTISFVSLIVGGLALIAALLMATRQRRPIAETEIPRPVDPPGRLIK